MSLQLLSNLHRFIVHVFTVLKFKFTGWWASARDFRAGSCGDGAQGQHSTTMGCTELQVSDGPHSFFPMLTLLVAFTWQRSRREPILQVCQLGVPGLAHMPPTRLGTLSSIGQAAPLRLPPFLLQCAHTTRSIHLAEKQARVNPAGMPTRSASTLPQLCLNFASTLPQPSLLPREERMRAKTNATLLTRLNTIPTHLESMQTDTQSWRYLQGKTNEGFPHF